jgi:hypothetical protein
MVADWVKGREWAAGRPRQGRSRAEAGPQGKGRLRGADRRARRMAAVLGNCPRARQARQGGWSWAAGRVQGHYNINTPVATHTLQQNGLCVARN